MVIIIPNLLSGNKDSLTLNWVHNVTITVKAP
jgi:hypothetical protein